MCLCYNPVQFSHCHGASICTSEHQKHILARNNFPRTTETLPGSDCLYTPCKFCCWIRTSWHHLWWRHYRNITAMTVFWWTFQQYFAASLLQRSGSLQPGTEDDFYLLWLCSVKDSGKNVKSFLDGECTMWTLHEQVGGSRVTGCLLWQPLIGSWGAWPRPRGVTLSEVMVQSKEIRSPIQIGLLQVSSPSRWT